MLWICNDCHEHFEVPEIGMDLDGGDHYVKVRMCPHCHSQNIDQYWEDDGNASAPEV